MRENIVLKAKSILKDREDLKNLWTWCGKESAAPPAPQIHDLSWTQIFIPVSYTLKLWLETWTLRVSEQIARHSPAWLWAAPATACRRGSPSHWRTLGSVPDQQLSQLKSKYCSPCTIVYYTNWDQACKSSPLQRVWKKADLPIERRKVWKEIAQSRFPLDRVH